MAEGIAALLALLDLETIEVNIFRGTSPDARRQRVFGGQVAAQALVAAGRTVEQGRVHSLHSYFLRPGDPTLPILYEVDRIRDGRSFTTRRVVAIQHGRAIFNLQCSFHLEEQGLEHQDEMPAAPGPDELPELADLLAPDDEAPRGNFRHPKGLDIRFVSEPPWERSDADQRREQLWLRTDSPVADDPLLHAAIATFASDLTLVDTILQRHGITPWSDSIVGASLDHCMWFHRPFRADEWLLYDQHSPTAHGARGLAHGALYTEDGRLVASIVQEGLVRLRRGA
ncbi:MAG TPA: acyl-CoA thioesterase II [Acidimicrobiales bacterium]|nr:acyl-CoA thioesterase II [Acidimicrobiales bacterium]